MRALKAIGITKNDNILGITSTSDVRGVALKGFIVARGWHTWFKGHRGIFAACLTEGTDPKEAIIFLGEDSEDDSGDPAVVHNSTHRAV